MPVSRKRFVMFGVGLVFVATAIVIVIMLADRPERGRKEGEHSSSNGDRVADGSIVSIRAVHPRMDSNLTVSVQQILSVEPLFEANLQAQVAGVVLKVPKDIGDRVAAR